MAHRFELAVIGATLAITGGLFACKAEKPKPAEKPAASKPAPKAEAPAASSDPECIGAWSDEGTEKKIAVGDKSYVLRGAHLKQVSNDDDNKIVLGVMANTKEDTPDNLTNIKSILEFFKTEGVEAIVIAGDLGENESQMVNVLTPIAAAGMPVFVTIGNRERKSDFNRAVASVAAKFPGVINMNFVRLASLDDVALVSVPGYYDKSYIHAKDGCHYRKTDLASLPSITESAGSAPVVLVSHGPPKQDGADAIDRTLEQANVGDPALKAAMSKAKVKFGIFANIQEAGGKGTDASGAKIIGPDSMVPELLLNPGATDSVSWQMNDGTRSVGMAAIMTVSGDQASYKVHRIPERG